MKNDLNIDNMIEEGCLITAGNINDYNTMTIGWGMKGIIWRRKTFIAYVKPCRYTYEFMEKNDYFTISFYEKDYKNRNVDGIKINIDNASTEKAQGVIVR